MKEQSDQGLHCLPFSLHRLDEGAIWSGSTLFAFPFALYGWRSSLIRVYPVYHSTCIVLIKEQSDQGLHCLPFRLHRLDEGVVWSGSTLSFRLHRLDEGAVWSGFTLFAIPFAWRSSLISVYTVCHSLKEQSDQSLHCLPLHLDEGAFRLHRLDKGAVWSGSTLFSILFGWRSSLIRVYTVCLSVCIVWTKEQSDQGLHCLPFICIVWMKE